MSVSKSHSLAYQTLNKPHSACCLRSGNQRIYGPQMEKTELSRVRKRGNFSFMHSIVLTHGHIEPINGRNSVYICTLLTGNYSDCKNCNDLVANTEE